ncbi:hypothetical protein ACWEVY_28630 [Streptomyces longwoodensis]
MSLLNDPIKVYRAPLVNDGYGPRRDWGSPEVVWSGLGAGVPYARSSKPDEATRETATNRATIYLPGDVAVDSADRVEFHDQLWHLEGAAWKWKLGSRQFTMLQAKVVSK